MTHPLHHSISASNASQDTPDKSPDITETDQATAEAADYRDRPCDLAMETQALQILDSSDDCIKVLDLDGKILFMNRGGQALLGIQDITPLLNTHWVTFWQEVEQSIVNDAIAQARSGEVSTFQGYCPTLSGEPKWWDSKISPMRGADGQIERLLCISRDITDRKRAEDERQQTEAALRESEEEFRLFASASSNTVYKMSADWREVRLLEGKNFLTSAQRSDQTWLEQYIPAAEQPRVLAAIAEAIRTKSTFELEHQVIQWDGAIGWAFSRAIPLLNDENEIVEWLGVASDVTAQKQSTLGAELLAKVTQNLVEATSVEDIIQTVGEQLHRYLQVSNCAFVEVNESAEVATIAHSWHQEEVSSLVGVYHLSEFVTGEFFQLARTGQSIIVRDVTTDSRIADSERFTRLRIGSFINVPLVRENEWKFTLGIYHSTAYNWRNDEIELMRELANRIWTKLERTRIEIALRQNQEMFSALVADAPFGLYMIDTEFRFQQANKTAIATFNLQPLIGRDLAEALRIIWREPLANQIIDRFRHTLATGESYYSLLLIEPRADIAEIQSYDWQIHRITLPDGNYGVVCYFYELSEIQRAEEIIRRNGDRHAFLVTLNDALRPLTNAIAIQATAMRVLGEYLEVNRVAYFEVQGADYVVEHDYVNGVESLKGGYAIESFGAELLATYRRGETAASADVEIDPHLSPEQRSAYANIQIAAYLGVPLVKQGKFVAGLAVHSNHPRNWTPDEISLAEEVAERTWAAVERARAEESLRESEAKYRGLFESLDEGYFLADVIFDENDQPIDILYIEANPAATRMVGQDFTGQRLSQIDPNYEAHWYAIFGRVARTGIGERLEQYAEPEQKWYDFYVFKVGGDNSHRVSVVFKDVTVAKHLEEGRKRREANLAFLADITEDFSRLSTADQIMQAIGAKIGAYLRVTTCNFTDVDEAQDQVIVHHGWSSPEVPSTVGTFRLSQYLSKEFERASRVGETVVICNTQTDPRTDAASYAALNMHSFVTVPFHRNGRWTHYIAICDSRPRDWHQDEIQLIEEISNRIFPRLERVRAEEALRVSEEKYRSLFESIDEGFCLIEVLFDAAGTACDYRFLEANPAFEKHTGLVDVLGKTVRELVPQHETVWFEIYGRIALTGVPERFENAAQELGRFYDVYAFRMGEPQEHKVAVLFNDISKRKQAEAEREQLLINEQHSANQLQGLANAALAINSALSVEDVLNVITHQAAAIIGSHQAVTSLTINHNWAQAINTMYLSDKYAQWQDYHDNPDGSGIYACVCHLNHSLRLTQAELEAHPQWNNLGKAADKHPPLRGWLAAPLVGRDGQNIGLIQLSDKYEGDFTAADESILVQLAQMASVALENTRLYEAEQQARAIAETSREEAQAANRVKDEFLAVLSHELRSPLNPILGWTRLLQNGKLDAARQQEALATIERNAKLQTQLIEDLLDISRIMRGKLSLTVAPVSLTYVISAAVETVRLAAEAKNIQIILHLAPEIAPISGDAARLQQVVWNLLTNAVKFTPNGGKVTVELSLESSRGVEEQQREGDSNTQPPEHPLPSYAQIRVIDTGKGIRSDFLPYVFEYFRQEDGSTTRKFGGLGLGLAIARQIVEMHGGSVWAESQGEGMGATFVVELPLPQITRSQELGAENLTLDTQPTIVSTPLTGVNILLVDDESDTREFQAFLLEQNGARVTAVASGAEALQVLEQAIPDVLISDIGMSEMDGYMLLQQIRTRLPEQGGKIPAIALTAYATELDQQRALQVGFQTHITKPVEPGTLVEAISTLLK